jgi:hypothetical protein
MNAVIGEHPQFKSLAWIGGLLATSAAAVVGAVLAVVFAATVLVITFMGGALLVLASLATKARRTSHARSATDGVIEARNVGGHSWVAYGWDRQAR